MQAALDAVTPGVSEAEVAAEIQHTITAAGSDYPGFGPLVHTLDYADHEHVAWSFLPRGHTRDTPKPPLSIQKRIQFVQARTQRP